jgi:TolA-binding protein
VAARLALSHAGANPEGFYAAELLFRAAENFKLGGEQQQARTVLELLARKYPESPYARQAPAN